MAIFGIDVFVNSLGEISVMKRCIGEDPLCVSFPKEIAEEVCNAILGAAIEAGKQNG